MSAGCRTGDTWTEATDLAWAHTAEAGDYLAEYDDDDLTAESDPGSRCGRDDSHLDDLRAVLRERGLALSADDRGLVAAVRS